MRPPPPTPKQLLSRKISGSPLGGEPSDFECMQYIEECRIYNAPQETLVGPSEIDQLIFLTDKTLAHKRCWLRMLSRPTLGV